MEIENLTIKEVKELSKLINGNLKGNNDIYTRYIDKYVLVRSRNEGINFGKVVQYDETGIVLSEARRLWYHRPAKSNVSWYEGVALTGLSIDSKVSPAVKEKLIVEEYSITQCLEIAIESIQKHPSNES